MSVNFPSSALFGGSMQLNCQVRNLLSHCQLFQPMAGDTGFTIICARNLSTPVASPNKHPRNRSNESIKLLFLAYLNLPLTYSIEDLETPDLLPNPR
jgi:hypothetical protein